MIQRIQSIYLLLVTGLLIASMCLPVGSLIDFNGAVSVFKPLGLTMGDTFQSTWGLVCILMLALIIISIVFWTKRGGEYYAFSTFASIVVAFFLGAVIYCADDEDRNSLPCASLCTFGALLSVFLVVLIALGGDGCDCDCGGCDGCDCGGGKKSRKLK